MVEFVEIARSNDGRVVVIDKNNPFATPQIFQEGDNKVGKIVLHKINGEYRVIVNVEPDKSTQNLRKISLIESDRKPGDNEQGIYVDPACYSGTTVIDIDELANDENLDGAKIIDLNDENEIPEGMVSLRLSQLLTMMEDNKIEDPLMQTALHKVVQSIREREGENYKFERAEYKYEPLKIIDNPEKASDDLKLEVTAEHSRNVKEKIDQIKKELDKTNLNAKEREELNKNLEKLQKQDFSYLGKYAKNVNGLRAKEDVVATIPIDSEGNITYVTQTRGGTNGLSSEVPAGRVVLKEILELAEKENLFQDITDERERALKYIAHKKGIELEQLNNEEQEELFTQYVAEKELSEEAGEKAGKVYKVGISNTPGTWHEKENRASITSYYLAIGTEPSQYDNDGEFGEISGKHSIPFADFIELIENGEIRDTNSIEGAYKALELFERMVESPEQYRFEYGDDTIKLAKK